MGRNGCPTALGGQRGKRRNLADLLSQRHPHKGQPTRKRQGKDIRFKRLSLDFDCVLEKRGDNGRGKLAAERAKVASYISPTWYTMLGREGVETCLRVESHVGRLFKSGCSHSRQNDYYDWSIITYGLKIVRKGCVKRTTRLSPMRKEKEKKRKCIIL